MTYCSVIVLAPCTVAAGLQVGDRGARQGAQVDAVVVGVEALVLDGDRRLLEDSSGICALGTIDAVDGAVQLGDQAAAGCRR